MARPTKLIKDVLAGRTLLKDASGPIQGACELHFYYAARSIMLLAPNDRKPAINKIPENLHHRVRYYAKRFIKKEQ